MSARIIFLNLCLAILFASQAKAQIIVSDGTKYRMIPSVKHKSLCNMKRAVSVIRKSRKMLRKKP